MLQVYLIMHLIGSALVFPILVLLISAEEEKPFIQTFNEITYHNSLLLILAMSALSWWFFVIILIITLLEMLNGR